MSPDTWPDVWHDLAEDEPLHQLVRVNGQLGTAVAPKGWPEVCKWASRHLPGQWIPKDKGLTWCNGSRYLWLVEPACLPPILDAVLLVRSKGLKCGWSIGSAARALLRYIGPSQYPERCMRSLLEPCRHGFFACYPGAWPDGVMYDVSSYYATMWSRLPSLRASLGRSGRVHWHVQPAGEETRRREVDEWVRPHKLLRNSLVGCSQGSERGQVYYHAGLKCRRLGDPGPFYGSAMLLVRAAYELTRLAHLETRSRYSRTDCVVTVDGEYPQVWDDYGYAVKLVCQGPTEVCSEGIYRCGPQATKWYQWGSRFVDPVGVAPLVGRSYLDGWCKAA